MTLDLAADLQGSQKLIRDDFGCKRKNQQEAQGVVHAWATGLFDQS